LDAFIKLIAIIACCTGVVFFCLGFIIGYDAITNISFAIGILCGNIPEGLIATVTISLGLTA
jgi:sodium/potassium-transporting ATPase subunit alpha